MGYHRKSWKSAASGCLIVVSRLTTAALVVVSASASFADCSPQPSQLTPIPQYQPVQFYVPTPPAAYLVQPSIREIPRGPLRRLFAPNRRVYHYGVSYQPMWYQRGTQR